MKNSSLVARIEILETRIAPAFGAVFSLGAIDGFNGFKLSGAADGDSSGFSVSSAGDVNGDGFDDVIIGAYLASEGGANRGASYVVFGMADGFDDFVSVLSGLDGNNGFKLVGVADNDFSGRSVSAAGDVNGDGFGDLLIGAYHADEGGPNRGASYVVFGKAGGFASSVALGTLDGSDGFKLTGVVDGDSSGYSVSAAGDVNGDSFADVLICAPGADEGGNLRGASYVVFGKAAGFTASVSLGTLDGTNGFKLSGVADGDEANSVSAAGDVNGDGFGDLLIGASRADEGGNNRGAGYVVFGKASGFTVSVALGSLNGSNGFKLSGVADFDYAGNAVSGAGDVNGDGFDDIIIAAYGAEEGGGNRGASYVVFGKAGGFTASMALGSLDGSNGFKLSGVAPDDRSGRSVSGAGDVNGDGFDDLLIGADLANEGGTNRGASYVVYGKAGGFAASVALASLDGSNGFKLSGIENGDYSGRSVSAAGDVNGDGFADLIIGAYEAKEGGTDRGATYIVFGQPDMKVELVSGSLILSEVGAASNANLTLSFIGNNLRITDPTHTFAVSAGVTLIDPHTIEVPHSSIAGSISIAPGAGDDSLLIDFSTISFFPTGFTFNGGADSDTLTLSGGSASSVSHVPLTSTTGTIAVDGTSTFYDGVEGITDTVNATNRIFAFDAASDTITFTSGLGTLTALTSNTAAPIQFESNVGLLALNSGVGSDIINVTSLNPSFNGFLLINTDLGDDTIILTATSPGYTGFVNVDGGSDLDTLTIASTFNANSLIANAEIIAPLAIFKIGPAHADFTTGRLSFLPTSGLSYKINDPMFGQLKVNGTLDLTDAALDITSALTSLPAGPLTLIDHAGTDPVIGNFDGLAEGATLTLNGGNFTITYTGGDGNDVQLIPVPPIPPGTIKLGELDGTTGFALHGVSSNGRTGGSVSSAGDINGDGLDDFIIGASEADYGQGAAYIVFGKTTGFPSPLILNTLDGTDGFKLEGIDSTTRLALSVSKAGDINGDGKDDLLASASVEGDGSTYVIFGKTTPFPASFSVTILNGTHGFTLQGLSAPDKGDHASVTAGDLNGDGFSDIIIGIPTATRPDGSQTGAAYIFFGKTTAPSVVDLSALTSADGFILHGENDGDRFGTSVTTGDINGDSFHDLVIGAPRNTPTVNPLNLKGAAYILFGKSTGLPDAALNGKTRFKISGGNEFSYLGTSVSAGDINGDGFDDILIGAPESDDSAIGTGTAYIIFGKRTGHTPTFDLAALNGNNGFALTGQNNFDSTAISIATAGDFNGDGFDDILIGAPGTNTNSYDSGTTYLLFGRPSGFPSTLPLSTINGTTGFKLLGNPYDKSGGSVSSAGDINGDGLDDILIGAPFADVTQGGREGKAYILFGSGTSHAIPNSQSKGKTLTFTDGDGDEINITVSKGKLTADMLTFGPDGGLLLVDLTVGGTFKDGANLTFSVKKTVRDGVIHVGAINAVGIKLGNVKITGDLGQIDIGSDPLKNALKSLTVGSLGLMGAAMQLPGTVDPLTSDILGNLPKFTVKGTINLANIHITGTLGKLTVGGDFLGTGALTGAQLAGLTALGHHPIANVSGGTTLASNGISAGNIGKLNVAGKLSNTAVKSTGNIGSVTAGGLNKAAIAAATIKIVKIFNDITSDDPNLPNVIAILGKLNPTTASKAVAVNTFTVNGNVTNAEILIGYNSDFQPTNPDVSLGKLTVKGTWTASSLAVGVADVTADGLGRNDQPIFAGLDGLGIDLTPKIIARIASIALGSLLTAPAEGTATAGDHYGITAQNIGKAKINGLKVPLLKATKLLPNKDTIAIGTQGDFLLIEV